MKTIRNGVFETNSSSTHVLAISKKFDFEEKDKIEFIKGLDFGWQYEIYYEPDVKFTYLLIAMSGMYYEDWKRGTDLITKALKMHGVKSIIYPEIKVKKYKDGKPIVVLKEHDSYEEESIIDHGETFVNELYKRFGLTGSNNYNNAGDFLLDALKDENYVSQFILGDSWISTGTDNEDGYYLPSKTGGIITGFLPDYPEEMVPEIEEFVKRYKELLEDYDIYLKNN